MTEPEVAERLYEALSVLPGGPVSVPVDVGNRAARRQRRRRTGLALGAGALVVAVALPAALVGHEPAGRGRPGTTRPGQGPAGAAALAKGHWSVLPRAPIAVRSGAAAVWTGTLMLVWGGEQGSDTPKVYADGAALDPESRTWSTLPAGPLSPRSSPATAWTGTEMVVWGGIDNGAYLSDGAAYNPVTKTWRLLASSPLPARYFATTVVSSGLVVILGGRGASGPAAGNAVYDPIRDTWQQLPALSQSRQHTYLTDNPASVTAGGKVLLQAAWSYQRHVSSTSYVGTSGIDTFLIDPVRRTVELQKTSGAAPGGAGRLIWTGSENLSLAARPFTAGAGGGIAMGLRGQRYDPASRRWSEISHGPTDDLNAQGIWSGEALLTYDTTTEIGAPDPADSHLPGEAAAWDPAQDRWYVLPRAPYSGASASVWTGHELIEWGDLFAVNAHGVRNVDDQTLAFLVDGEPSPSPSGIPGCGGPYQTSPAPCDPSHPIK